MFYRIKNVAKFRYKFINKIRIVTREIFVVSEGEVKFFDKFIKMFIYINVYYGSLVIYYFRVKLK